MPAARRRPRPGRHPNRQMPEVAPAYLSDTAAPDILALLRDAIGEGLEARPRGPPLRPVRGPPHPVRHRPVTATATVTARHR
ncbi:hypothetical protein GCM10010211_71650 [Streptomyces albospinus]|uniref:Uncharacterized protein n=1 Tax=Streptomyces albospinus TaxID=285515 RepID=A0ABQ2VLC2_9ACTN|nr:hypothetical protein GCM10010211_71650 [Streptomyces albospinus]